MGKVKVHAGDFINGGTPGSFTFGNFTLCTEQKRWMGESISANQLESVELATEESVKRLGGTVGWGGLGGVLLGPVGLLAGLFLGGRGKDVTFVAQFKDGRRLLATTDSKTYTKMLAYVFK